MITTETIQTIKNATIRFISNGTEYRSVLPDSSFQSLLLARTLDNPTEESHILIRDAFLDIMDTKIRLFNFPQVDSFRFTYEDGEGYKHIIER